MANLNWGFIQDGGTFESLMHAILYAEDAGIVLFGRPGKDGGQDARSGDGAIVYQAKYRQNLSMDGAVQLALDELNGIKKYRESAHSNYIHWKNARRWVLVANILTNPNDDAVWRLKVITEFQKEGLAAEYWGIKILSGKLAELPHVREVFFEGENRILIGLKEAYDRLSNECIGSASMTKPLVGRDNDLKAIFDFVSDADKRVLPIIGIAGIGKSRVMYEAVAKLAQDGWRVHWALSEAMSRSSRWFQFLNGNQPTCVVIDDPSDAGLLAAVIEQLAPIERGNWKVIVGCRTSRAEMFRPFQKSLLVASSLVLGELNEEQSKELLKSNLTVTLPEAQIHTIYHHTGGIPGWLCLVADLCNRSALRQLPQSVDDIAADYVADCVKKIDSVDRSKAQVLMQYLALWGTLSLGSGSDEHSQAKFLATQDLAEGDTSRLLEQFVRIGIVRNWGVGKRLFAIQPLMMREHVLSTWLFSRDGDAYRVNDEGRRIIEMIVHGSLPATTMALSTISHLTRSRLGVSQGFSFVKPVFDELQRIAETGTVIEQDNILPLVETLGASDPESALDVVKTIEKQVKPSVTIEDQFWGTATVTHDSVLVKLPWTLFKIAAFVYDTTVAGRYLEEFRVMLSLETGAHEEIENGKKPSKLLEQILRESKNSHVFAGRAGKIVENELCNPGSWPFVGIALECLIHPEREYTEWTAKLTLTFTKHILLPKSPDWDEAMRLRGIAFGSLRTLTNLELRPKIWRILAESHQEFHRLLLHQRAQGPIADEYMVLLIDDLTTAGSILERPPVSKNVREIVSARSMWSWYLEYGKSEKLVDLAKRCEAACTEGTIWRPQDFFRFDTDEALQPETQRVLAVFRNAVDENPFKEFFSEAKAYLDAARAGGEDMADSIRIFALADALVEEFHPSADAKTNPLSFFVQSILQQEQNTNYLEWNFSVRICQRYILRFKSERPGSEITDDLQQLLEICRDKPRFLFDIYSNPHPLNTGTLTAGEFDCVFANADGFTQRQQFILLGIFAPTLWDAVRSHLIHNCQNLSGQREELSNCIALFLRMFHLTVLRYDLRDLTSQITWILDAISEHGLDGRILGNHEFKWLREKSGFSLSPSALVKLIRGRIRLERSPRTNSAFRTLPFEFQIGDWCKFDLTQHADCEAFEEFCGLALEDGFVALHYMPKFMAEIDTSGVFVAAFVGKHLRKHLSPSGDDLARLGFVASAYADSTDAWARIATPICEAAVSLERRERERVFMGLARKETAVLSSSPGEVPKYYFDMRDTAERMLNRETPDSPLRGYREWALRRAEADLQFEKQRAEEVKND